MYGVILPRDHWTPAQALAVARLILDPACNGGTASGLTPEDVAQAMPAAPAWAVFEDETCAFCVGLNPFSWNPELTRLRGILHFARRPGFSVLAGYRVTASFLDAVRGVEVMTFTAVPGLVRLGERLGLPVLGTEGGYTVLGR